ncbi:hypothetical protein [Alkalihalobacillus sp. AL-G]|uniref:hypothetical protein n=1 Tax=Alkalihalobacillus sp. AL-G TaxID=2926399 RepID=UPI00272BC742|nr:hypothetical protein [Alkalihalobacillus sp. AL-G]WLD94524.1 hypothetical protein MOJ78_06460 [Alkalihalobacillus sp. AL-G]
MGTGDCEVEQTTDDAAIGAVLAQGVTSKGEYEHDGVMLSDETGKFNTRTI